MYYMQELIKLVTKNRIIVSLCYQWVVFRMVQVPLACWICLAMSQSGSKTIMMQAITLLQIITPPTGPAVRSAYFKRVNRGGSFAEEDSYIRVSKRAATLGPDYSADLDGPAYIGEYSPRIAFRCAEGN